MIKDYPKIIAHRILDLGGNEKPAISINIVIKLCRGYSDKGAIYHVRLTNSDLFTCEGNIFHA